ncbi:LysR family transcriptional regulator [Chondromyces apiculatus]|uniref:Transcriptional regulator, LysR family n=1 Tax=Chondromyces apiculatus DSM 436 TaxID=1192034 RepID=A0A017STI2_9BACT|nr:LysR family transcriptional regulator [Chondromyces apiculatus]EYF00313.1 Transcriptional regulator, LysR family [Chondromyces apiculatus DSM 436]
MRGTEYADLAAFVAVAQERSFRRASARLGLSPSALSHTIRALEERLGAKLLNRTTRSVAPTEAGLSLLQRLAPAFADITSAVEGVNAFRERPTGTLRLNVPRMAANMVLAPLFGRFARDYPDVRLEVLVEDGLIDIVAQGFDAGIRLGEYVQRDMVAVRVTPDLRAAVVGSPAYLAARPAPRTPRDLRKHACIGFRQVTSGAMYRWEFEREGEALEVAVEGPLTLDDPDLMVAAALDGVGLACSLEHHVADHLAAGRLVRVLEDWCPPFPGFFLYYPGRRQMPAALRALIDLIQAATSEAAAARVVTPPAP